MPPVIPSEAEFFTTFEALPPGGRVHIVGAGPVGLLLAALLQSVEDIDVRLYEKRREYTRGRMVQLEPFLTSESVEDYCTDPIDGDNVGAVFDPMELHEAIEYRRSVPSDLMTLLRRLSAGFCPLNAIEQSLSDLIDTRESTSVQRIATAVTPEDAIALLEPGDMLIDCSGSNSLLRDRLVPSSAGEDAAGNTHTIRLEYALVVTFLYGQAYDCNEYCKYYKNAGNDRYKFIPSVHRTYSDGNVTHVTGIVTISDDEFAAMPPRFDGIWLRDNFPDVAESMDRFIDKIKDETHGELVGELEIIRIPLNLYRARNATSRPWHVAGPFHHPFASTPVFLLGDSAIGSPYFQSISLGFECAMFLARLIAIRDLPMQEMFDRYEQYVYKQWLRVYMRSKVIKHNKDLLECIDDTDSVLEKLYLY
jgi:2-polyprenyl-6-methoxyphenol hydroxylase-like FAD-dependent oxidoreductase